jgi:crotonobetainyl-CoA:carnitine CoA-transferase CaiB-like acyl-CoA transferase
MPSLPLEGIRVLDFTWVISGPQCTQILGDFGAEVIKIEWPHHPDGLRNRAQPPGTDPASWEHSGLWNNLNRNKRSITLNMRHPSAIGLALDLVSRCDVVVANMGPHVMDSWGLSWDVMSEVRPGLVYACMTGFGLDGPNADYVVFGPVMQAISGIHGMTGRPASEPAGLGYSYGDYVAGYYGALAVVAALQDREVTGNGAMIDLGQVEASVTLTSAALLDYQVNGRAFTGWGNVPFGATDAPAGLFRCRGDDSWCAISVRTDEDWAALTGVLGRVDLAADTRFGTVSGRAGHRPLLDRLVAAWTEPRPRDEVVKELADAGVPCSPLLTAQELLADPALRGRRYYQKGIHPLLGEREFQMGGIASHTGGPELRRAAPMFGEANEDVYCGLLGLSPERVRQLADEAVI